MTPSSAFATLISMKQGEKTQKFVAKYVCDRLCERERRVKYNLVYLYKFYKCTPL